MIPDNNNSENCNDCVHLIKRTEYERFNSTIGLFWCNKEMFFEAKHIGITRKLKKPIFCKNKLTKKRVG
jgi:hypothetical protein